jgi:hypothetical protein
MKKIIEQVAEWPLLQQLPDSFAGFALTVVQQQCANQYLIFSYDCPERQRSFAVLYDNATKDFLARVTVGLTEYYDVSFIVTSLAALETALGERLRPVLDGLARTGGPVADSVFSGKKIGDWAYGASLPREAAGFVLFIDPRSPVRTINGSYIIIDYSDFAAESGLVICYNVYRDEFFGETRLRRTPQTTALFDAKELSELAAKLDANLAPVLTALRRQL